MPEDFNVGHTKLSRDRESAEAVRQERVPFYYTGCRYRVVHFNEAYARGTKPSFIECTHPDFRLQSEECRGHCFLAGFPYGSPEDALIRYPNGMRGPMRFGW